VVLTVTAAAYDSGLLLVKVQVSSTAPLTATQSRTAAVRRRGPAIRTEAGSCALESRSLQVPPLMEFSIYRPTAFSFPIAVASRNLQITEYRRSARGPMTFYGMSQLHAAVRALVPRRPRSLASHRERRGGCLPGDQRHRLARGGLAGFSLSGTAVID
jgi:hypothetical protein